MVDMYLDIFKLITRYSKYDINQMCDAQNFIGQGLDVMPHHYKKYEIHSILNSICNEETWLLYSGNV